MQITNPHQTIKSPELNRFIQETNRTVMRSINGWRAIKNQEPAIKIRLGILKVLLSDAQVLIASPFEIPSQRKEAALRAAWLKNKIKQLEKRVAMIERRKPAVPAVAPVTQKQCEHKRTENRNSFGNRQIRIVCLDCRVLVHSEWSMSC